MPKRRVTSATSSARTKSTKPNRSFSVAASLTLAALLCGAAPSPRLPPLADLLRQYADATQVKGAKPLESLEVDGDVAGSGLTGHFHTWRSGNRERNDSSLGIRSERVLTIGERVTIENGNGNVRELRGIIARRYRTQRYVDSGDFVDRPETVKLLGATVVGNRKGYRIEVTAPGGEPETVVIDAVTSLPLRIEYIEGDGPLTIDFADWREIDGHRFPFRAVISDGEHAFDFTETTRNVRSNPAIAESVFAPQVGRFFEMPEPVTVPVLEINAHFYCMVTIAGKQYRFLIDSGAQSIVLDSHVAREAGVREEGAMEVRGAVRAGGLHLARLSKLDIGAASLRDIVAASIDLGGSSGGTLRIDGILGYPLFAAGLVRIDPVAKTMTLAKPGGLALRGTKLDLELDRALPEAMLTLNGTVRAPFILDTGNSSEILLYRWFVDRNPGIVPFTGDSRGSYGIGGRAASYRTTLDEIEIGGVKFFQRITAVMLETHGAFADRYDAGNVGLGVLRNFVLTFDEPNYALYLEAIPDVDNRARLDVRPNFPGPRTPTRLP